MVFAKDTKRAIILTTKEQIDAMQRKPSPEIAKRNKELLTMFEDTCLRNGRKKQTKKA